MRTSSVGTWRSPKSLENIAERIENCLGWQEAEKNVMEGVMKKNDSVPQYVSPLGHDMAGTMIGREIHRRTLAPNLTWDQRGEEALSEAKAVEEADEAKQKAIEKMWKSKEQEYDSIIEKLSSKTFNNV